MKPWPKEVNEAIWALRCEGMYPTEITRVLNNGDGPLDEPVPIPRNTVVDKVARLIKERGEPKTFVAKGRELDAAGSLRRKALDMAKREIEELEAHEHLTEKQVKHLIALVKLVDDIETRLRDREREKDQDMAALGRKGGGRAASNILAEIQANEAKRAARKRAENGDEPPAAGTSPEPR